jgi:hypothetical protein
MTANQTGDSGEISEEEIRSKRMTTLVGVHDLMRTWKEVADNTRLDANDSTRTVEEYITEWKVLKQRDKIPRRIQRHKIAGLMVAAIVHHRPLKDFFPDECGGSSSLSNSCDNEKFAVYHGVAVCAEDCPENRMKVLLANPHFTAWVDNFVALLHTESPCRQSLIHIFETLCLAFFPENLGHATDAG